MNLWGTGWLSDFPAASGFYSPLLSCVGQQARLTLPQVCNRAFDAQAERAERLQLLDPGRAQRLWRDLYEKLDRQAVTIATDSGVHLALLSPKVRNYQAHPIYGDILEGFFAG